MNIQRICILASLTAGTSFPLLAQTCPQPAEFYRQDFVKSGSMASVTCYLKLIQAPPPTAVPPQRPLTPSKGALTQKISPAPPLSILSPKPSTPPPKVETVPPALPSIPPQEEATRPTLPLPKPLEVPQTYEIQLGRFGDHQERVTLSQVGQQLKAVHTTDVVNKFWGNTTAYQHSITKFRACTLGDFERKNCVTVEGDSLTLAEGLTPYDVILDLQFNENGQAIYRSFRAIQGGTPVLFETLPF